MDIETLALAKAYTKASLAGAGAVKGEKGDTGEAGKDGVSPTVASTGSAESGEVAGTITDAGGNVISVYNGAKGEKGDKGAQGEKGADGAAGTNGTDGKDGADGTSPEVTITETDGGRILAVTDAGGKKSTFIKDGTDAGDVPTKTSDLANDSGFITQATSALENYYLKSQLYTQDEINNLVSGLGKLKSSIVTALPTENIDTSTIYLIQDSGDTSSYTQWMYINSAWAELGSTSVDLSSYYTKTQADTLLKAKADTTAVPTKTSELSNDAGFLDAGGVDSRVSDKMADYLKIETAASLLDAKADASAVYTKTEADTLLGKKVDAADGKGLSANDLTDELKTAYDKAVTDGHTHSNKDVLDTVTADVVSSSHTHANKDALDTLTADDITQIGTNKTDIATLQDTVSGLIDDTKASSETTYSSSNLAALLDAKVRRTSTTMVDLGYTAGSTVDFFEFLKALQTKYGSAPLLLQFDWNWASAAKITLDSTTITIPGGWMLIAKNNLTATDIYCSAEGLLFEVNTSSLYYFSLRVGSTANTLEYKNLSMISSTATKTKFTNVHVATSTSYPANYQVVAPTSAVYHFKQTKISADGTLTVNECYVTNGVLCKVTEGGSMTLTDGTFQSTLVYNYPSDTAKITEIEVLSGSLTSYQYV